MPGREARSKSKVEDENVWKWEEGMKHWEGEIKLFSLGSSNLVSRFYTPGSLCCICTIGTLENIGRYLNSGIGQQFF